MMIFNVFGRLIGVKRSEAGYLLFNVSGAEYKCSRIYGHVFNVLMLHQT